MHEAVSDVLANRAREADGLSRMVLYSLIAHVVLVAAIALVPSGWISSHRDAETTPVMISLNGAPGPDTGGQTQMTARAVQEVGKTERLPFTPPPASRTPEMTVPEPAPVKPVPKPRTVEKPAPEKTNARKPVTGEEVTSGAARVDTRGVAVPFGGLSRTGGTGLSAASNLGLENFCCPEYIDLMLQSVRRNWNEDQGAGGTVVVKYTIRRDGVLTQFAVTKPSGNFLLDQESLRAVTKTRQLPPLPAEYTEQVLTIHLTFEYKR